LLDQIDGPIASFTGDGAYDQDGVYSAVVARHPEAAVIVPPRSNAVPSETAETAPTPRDRHLQAIAEHGRMGVGRKPRGTTGVPWWKPISAGGNGSSVMHCAHKPKSVKQPKWHLLSTSSTARWRWDAQATSASYETTRTRDHCV